MPTVKIQYYQEDKREGVRDDGLGILEVLKKKSELGLNFIIQLNKKL